jgi:hypothetical protein
MSNLSRRSLLAGGAALVALPTAAAAMPAVTPSPDAKLLALVEQYIAAETGFRRVCTELSCGEDQMMEAGRRQSRPDVVRVRPEDEGLELPMPLDASIRKDATAEFYRSCDIDKLASAEWRRCEKIKLPAGIEAIANTDDPIRRYLDLTSVLIACTKFTPTPAARARADEIVAALQAEQKAIKAAERKLGLRKIERERDRACRRASRLLEQIVETDAHTMAGIMAKVRCIRLHYQGGEITLDDDEGTSELALSVASDLARLGTSDATAAAA